MTRARDSVSVTLPDLEPRYAVVILREDQLDLIAQRVVAAIGLGLAPERLARAMDLVWARGSDVGLRFVGHEQQPEYARRVAAAHSDEETA